ncbi:hypothetical protein K505DRAFT_3840 [Melanomma pulvis-pyrius CBS 109.77]|uniref:Uncharacterized protein n=1 Tax=Melanomma pulvis-pyrius CBS 109.77 TaxID=1314802 RepID=A0A6A6XJ83_9PLEO|nr:hypothetical protein K505DRAFT_3840 [Melanomma pulvis-pyrius CBS 109.77]
MPMGISRNTTPSHFFQLSRSRTDSATRSCSPQTSPREPKTGRGNSSNYRSGTNIAYQITDLAHYHMPKGSSMVAVTVHRSDSNASFDPIALDHRLLGGEGEVFRMVQLSSNSWMLLGYRYDHGEPGACTRKSPTLLNVGQASDLFSDAVSHNTDYVDDDEESENGEEDLGECRTHAGNGKRRTQIVSRFPGRSEGRGQTALFHVTQQAFEKLLRDPHDLR